MKITGSQFAKVVGQITGARGLATLVLFGCLGFAPTVARADVFYIVDAQVGDKANGQVGKYTGLSVTGWLDLTAIEANKGSGEVSLSVEDDPNIFSGVSPCSVYPCASVFNNAFDEYGLINIGNPATFTGGPLPSGSYINLVTPLGAAPGSPGYGPEVEYSLVGEQDSIVTATSLPAASPEPGFYAVLALGLSGLLFAGWRRRSA